MSDSSTVTYLAEWLQKQGNDLWGEPIRCRNQLMDFLGPVVPEKAACLSAIALSGYPLTLWQIATSGGELKAVALSEEQQTMLEQRFTSSQIQDSTHIWCEAVAQLQKTAMTPAENDLVQMVIVPKVKTGELTTQSEQEIYDAAEVKNIPRARTGKLIDEYLTQHNTRSSKKHSGAFRLSAEMEMLGRSQTRHAQSDIDDSFHKGTTEPPSPAPEIPLTAPVGLTLAALVGIPLVVVSLYNLSLPTAPQSTPTPQVTPVPTPVKTPTPDPNAEKSTVEAVIQNWQSIKRNAFVNKDTSSLKTVLTDKKLEETIGGVNWWINNGTYYDIQLHSLTFLNTKISGNVAKVRASISETKDNSVEGRNTSTYVVNYNLVKQNGSWYISELEVEK